MPVTHYVAETKILRRVALNKPRYLWGIHAPTEMANENPPVTEGDIQHALQNGTVLLEEYGRDTRWRVRGKDLDGRSIIIIVAVYEDDNAIKVVTVFSGTK